ncbi:hypothetical protein K504DRAFT_133291 [Pleomassaria siparia CBS 279.74]|uniref:Uncharacterized protein n=1 Tax=Pleomassaria siparia CBS 279.74 TaxID=1314801 RepID=A0A6G1KLD1_9PLEO|nr:hypothetical protein K504DRAFT_133291 [Pleomassaria siparia CBS 279.74]
MYVWGQILLPYGLSPLHHYIQSTGQHVAVPLGSQRWHTPSLRQLSTSAAKGNFRDRRALNMGIAVARGVTRVDNDRTKSAKDGKKKEKPLVKNRVRKPEKKRSDRYLQSLQQVPGSRKTRHSGQQIEFMPKAWNKKPEDLIKKKNSNQTGRNKDDAWMDDENKEANPPACQFNSHAAITVTAPDLSSIRYTPAAQEHDRLGMLFREGSESMPKVRHIQTRDWTREDRAVVLRGKKVTRKRKRLKTNGCVMKEGVSAILPPEDIAQPTVDRHDYAVSSVQQPYGIPGKLDVFCEPNEIPHVGQSVKFKQPQKTCQFKCRTHQLLFAAIPTRRPCVVSGNLEDWQDSKNSHLTILSIFLRERP